jgi:hypothetical protein
MLCVNTWGLAVSERTIATRTTRNTMEVQVMRNLPIVLFSVLLMLSGALHAATWSPTTRIDSILVMDSIGIVRMEVLRNNPVFNPANCTDLDFVDIVLDAPGRSVEEQRQMLNEINMAFITRRQIAFLILDDAADPASCSTAGTSGSIRIATGVRVHY